jgi:hypothetical protein
VILDDLRRVPGGKRNVLGVDDLGVSPAVGLVRRFEVAVVVGGVDDRKIQLDDEAVQG